MRAEALALGLTALLCAGASAGDLGRTVTFGSAGDLSFSASAARGTSAPGVVYDSGDSDPIGQAWDTVLLQGELPDASVTFQAARAGSSNWVTLETHRTPDGRFWAKGRLSLSSGPVRLRALAASGAPAGTTAVYGVTVFASSAKEAAAAPGPAVPPRGPQDPSAPRPLVHGRAEWGAVAPTQPWAPDPLPWRVTLHHSDGRYTRTLAESEAEARFIQDFHIHGRGWIDIAYHYLVDPEGNILEGRPEGVLGAHTLGNNEGNIGIVLLGTYHPPVNDKPTQVQLDAVAALGRYLVRRYGIDPRMLKGHRDYKATDCPGDWAYAKLDYLRLAFAGVPASASAARRSHGAPRASFVWRGVPSWDGVRR